MKFYCNRCLMTGFESTMFTSKDRSVINYRTCYDINSSY